VTPPRIRVRIERLVIDGASAPPPGQLAAGIEAELGRLVAARGLPAGTASGHTPVVSAEGTGRGAAGQPQPLARTVAGCVYERLGHGGA
jgi:hypothetical protein